MLFLAWSFAVYLLLVAGVETRGNGAESCSLNTARMYEISPNYSLQENPDIHLTLQHIYRTSTFTQVMDEKGTCIVGLNYKNRTQGDKDKRCEAIFASEDEYTSLVFQQLGHEVTVYQKDNVREKKVTLTTRPQSLWVKTNGTVNVLTGCPGNCYQFEQAVIHKHYPEESETQEPIIIYGRIKNKTSYKSSIGVRNGKNEWPMLADFNEALKQKKEDIWFSFAVKPSFTKCQENDKCPDQHNYLMDIVVTDLSTNESIPLSKSSKFEVNSTDLYLGFYRSSNIRWDFCNPRAPTPKAPMTMAPTQKAPMSTTPMPMAQTPSGHFSVSLKEKVYLVALVVSPVHLLVLFGHWIYIFHLLRRLKALSQRTPPSPTIPLATIPRPLQNARASLNNTMNEAAADNASLAGHEYEEIDHEALQGQLAAERSAARINTLGHEAPRAEQEEISTQRNRYMSVKSVYGCATNSN